MYKDNWYNNIGKSKLNPPSWVFGVVWPILYALMAASFILILMNKKNDKTFILGMIMFSLQFIFNIVWTQIFFKLHKPKWALLDLYLTIIFTGLTIYFFNMIYPLSAYLLVPYFIWICFASYLNLYIVLNN